MTRLGITMRLGLRFTSLGYLRGMVLVAATFGGFEDIQ